MLKYEWNSRLFYKSYYHLTEGMSFTFKQAQTKHKLLDLRAAPHSMTYLKLNIHNFCIMEAISFKLWQLICEIYMKRP